MTYCLIFLDYLRKFFFGSFSKKALKIPLGSHSVFLRDFLLKLFQKLFQKFLLKFYQILLKSFLSGNSLGSSSKNSYRSTSRNTFKSYFNEILRISPKVPPEILSRTATVVSVVFSEFPFEIHQECPYYFRPVFLRSFYGRA